MYSIYLHKYRIYYDLFQCVTYASTKFFAQCVCTMSKRYDRKFSGKPHDLLPVMYVADIMAIISIPPFYTILECD